jgi:hypothetical protein
LALFFRPLAIGFVDIDATRFQKFFVDIPNGANSLERNGCAMVFAKHGRFIHSFEYDAC